MSDRPLSQSIGAILKSESRRLTRAVIGLYLLLGLANVAAWAWALFAFRDYPALLGTAFLAYGFGLRHAVDADHIAAIDNVTRKMMQAGHRPIGVGLFFSLGHSTVVTLGAGLLAFTAGRAWAYFGAIRTVGGLIGTSVSAFVLLALAVFNLVIFVGVYRTFQRVRAGGRLIEEDFDLLLVSRGFLSALFRPLFRFIERSWQMFPIGFLFGLGFDTASEVALLGISAAEGAKGLSLWSIMVFPALFAAGMSLVDTTDGILMVGAYNWAFLKPIRKLYYNMTITLISVLVALIIGGIEVLGLVARSVQPTGRLWHVVGALNGNFGTLGFVIIGLFIASWIVSVAIYRLKGYDRIEVKT